jgi:hypothetical protein
MNRYPCLRGFDSYPKDDNAELETFVRNRLSGRVLDLRVLLQDDGVVLCGHTHTYYAKQLAQHAVMKATDRPIVANLIEVC